jgi:hypothetical protein
MHFAKKTGGFTLVLKFGVGCFHFTYITEAYEKQQFIDYIDKVKNLLGSVASINNINISENLSFRLSNLISGFYSEKFEQSYENINGNNGIVPFLGSFKISFDIYIPHRVQNELVKFPINTGTEKFSVTIRYDNYFPVAFVEPGGAAEDCIPSDGVTIVREFLKKELNGKSDIIKFSCMGPSPYHADFKISAQNDSSEERKVDLQYTKNRGYDEYLFNYN